MASIPVWLTGKHVTACAVVPQSVATNGTLTPGSSTSLVGSLDEISLNSSPETEEISHLGATYANTVLIRRKQQVTLTEILKSNGTNILAATATAYDVVQVNLTRGAQSWSFYGIVTGYREDIRRGKSTAVMTLDMVDPNTTNPTYS